MTLRSIGPKVEILDERGCVICAIYATTTGVAINSDRLEGRARRRVDPVAFSTGDPGIAYVDLDRAESPRGRESAEAFSETGTQNPG
jgi:hypothetical protein